MTFYYVEPQPERFVEEVRKLAEQGVLANPERAFPALVFLSRVIAANGSRVEAWFEALSDLPPDALKSLEVAAFRSRSPEAQAYLATRGFDSTGDAEQPELLEMNIEHPAVLDGLWAHYFATGDHRAVRRIISALDFMTDFGAAKAYATSKKTDVDQARALRDGIFQAASWSLESLMREHVPLKEFCAGLVRSGDDLTSNERCALAIVLSKLEPALWRVEIDPQSNKATIAWTDAAQPTGPKKPWWKPW
jgi:hypothetical protein